MLHLKVIFGLIICFHGVNSADSLSEHCETDFTGMSRNDVIEHYFHKGFLHKEIYAVLRTLHAITASVGILKHVLRNVDVFEEMLPLGTCTMLLYALHEINWNAVDGV